MTILQMECFVETAKRHSMSKAAEQLYISQQCISKHIKSLEKELGFPLFERHNKGCSLTSSGKILFDVWDKMIYEHHVALDRARDDYYENRDKIKIGLLDCGCFHNVFANNIISFNENYPDIQIEYEFHQIDSLLFGLSKGTLNFILVYKSEIQDLDSYYSLDVSDQPILAGLYLSKKHPLAAKKSFQPSMLNGQVLGVLDTESSRDYKEKSKEFIMRYHLENSVTCKYYSARHNLGLALASKKCISIGYETMFEYMKDKLVFLPIYDLAESGMIVLAWKDKRFTSKAKILAEFILKNQI